jgi:UDP-N-acetylglucosamine 4,6-dehydratase
LDWAEVIVKSVLITGGSGAFGTAFAQRLLAVNNGPNRIVILSRGEHRQAEMARELGPMDPDQRLRFFIGDVRDNDRLRHAVAGIDVIIHAAALKRIEVGAYNPLEVKKTNIDGAANVIDAAMNGDIGYPPCIMPRKVVVLSSDKAFEPISAYGTSKAFAESLFLAANNTRGHNGPMFSVVRYGNVWCSAGSVVPTWRKILETSDTVPVTDPECTRFFMTMDEAVDLVVRTAENMKGGEIAIPTLPAYRLGDLAEAMGAKMNVLGLPTYEKRHESMGAGHSSDKARRMSVEELRRALACP